MCGIHFTRLHIAHMRYKHHTLREKPSKPTRANPTPTKEKPTTAYDQSTQDERKIRTIGTISITSKSVPHAPTQKSAAKYVIASWQTRGHIRHYKSGKTVYIKPSIHHRHALKQNAAPAPVTIKLNTERTESDA